MYARVGYFVGDVSHANRPRFERGLRDDIMPMVARLPGVIEARLMWGREYEEHAPRVYAAIMLTFPSPEAVQVALASPGRAAMRACDRSSGPTGSTSSAAAHSLPDRKPRSTASSPTTPPRDVLISTASGFISAIARSSISRVVSGVIGQCRLTMSARPSSAS